MKRILSHAIKATLAVVGLGVLITCENRPTEITNLEGSSQPRIATVVSRADAMTGEPIVVAVRSLGGLRLSGLQGCLRFDPNALAYRGQYVEGTTATLTNNSESGTLRLASFNVDVMGADVVKLAFEVNRAGYAESLSFSPEAAAGLDESVMRDIEVTATTLIDRQLGRPDGQHRLMSLRDWIAREGVESLDRVEIAAVPGQIIPGLRYGDADLDGQVNIIDAFFIANAGVGNVPLLADSSKDHVVAGNTRPANLPGLGEVGDDTPPGLESSGERVIDVLDALAAAREGAGLPSDIAGEVIPGRVTEPTERVLVSGDIDSARTFTADSVYELRGTVNVLHSALLTIEAGTIVEGDSKTRGALVVQPGAGIDARGTQLQPVVFRCSSPSGGPSCWGGISILGFSTLNPAVSASAGVDFVPCPTRTIQNVGTYGGCVGYHNSGELSYVRIEGAGRAFDTGSPTPGLQLLGLGSETIIRSVQVHESGGDGIYVSGGRVDIAEIVVTRQLGSGIVWDDGWTGRGQFIVVQAGATVNHSAMLSGSNSPYSGAHDNTPRSDPELYNVTLVATEVPTAGSLKGVHLKNGSAGLIRNLVVLGVGDAAVDIDSIATCAQAGVGGALRIEAALLHGNAEAFASDTDCIDEPTWGLVTMPGNRLEDPRLIDPENIFIPDMRPVLGSPAVTGAVVPPADGFFDASAVFIGAVPPAPLTANTVPWYSGWTVGSPSSQ